MTYHATVYADSSVKTVTASSDRAFQVVAACEEGAIRTTLFTHYGMLRFRVEQIDWPTGEVVAVIHEGPFARWVPESKHQLGVAPKIYERAV